MNGRNNALLEMLLQAENNRQVPPGNPLADYFHSKATNAGASGLAKGAAGYPMMASGLMETLLELNPVVGVPLGLSGLALTQSSKHDYRDMAKADQGANMWFNRFGSGDPRQSLPGTPGGPAYRRKYGD